MATTRTDVHRPASPDFDPQAYEFRGIWDMHPDYPNPAAVQARLAVIRELIDAGYRFGAGSSQQCGHCGTNIRYAALMVHTTVREFIYVGETCLDERFHAMTAAEFQALRKTAKLNRERVAKVDRIAALVTAHPLLADLTYPDITGWADAGSFLSDVAERFRRDGRLTPNQVGAVERTIRRNVRKANETATRAAAVAAGTVKPAPTGRVTVTGEIVAAKEHTGGYRDVEWKMTVRTDDGWRVWLTIPANLVSWAMDAQRQLPKDEAWVGWTSLLRGQRVTFTATLTASDDDATFAFGKRPTGAQILAATP